MGRARRALSGVIAIMELCQLGGCGPSSPEAPAASAGKAGGGGSAGQSYGQAGDGGGRMQLNPDEGGSASGGASSRGGARNNEAGGGTRAGAQGDAGSAQFPPFEDPYQGASGCPSGGFPIGRGACLMSMPLSGDLSKLISMPDQVSCGVGRDTGFTLATLQKFEVRVNFASPITRGISGDTPPASVQLVLDAQTPAARSWSTPPGTCRVTLTSNVCWYFEIPDAYYLISGTGSCSEAAQPDGDNPGAPEAIGDFYFATAVYP